MRDFYELFKENAKKQEEDIKTVRVREDFQVKVSDRELDMLKTMAYEVGLPTPGDLISSFIGDLTGCFPNGSDESMYADSWIERTYGKWNTYFRHFLYVEGYGDIDYMKDLLEYPEEFDEIYEEYEDFKEHGKDLQTKEECIQVLKDIIELGKDL